MIYDADAYGADEMFLTGTTREMIPVVQVEDRTIGSGLPGPVTKTLHETFRKLAATRVSSP
jgi:branched-subunit amino acid aminotransferase/4-amino-4-deoxychorismate lyase